MSDRENIIWSTENLVFFGMWLVEKGEIGYGMLCIHGSCLGVKIGTLLKLKWTDYIDVNEDGHECYSELIILDKKQNQQRIPLSEFIQRYTEFVFNKDLENNKDRDFESFVYFNSKSRKVLSTSSLNRELNKFYDQFKEEVLTKTHLILKLRELKTSSFEIAWARDMVLKYNCSKKVFILVSKYMGHRTVNDTIRILELEPNEDIVLSYDMFNPSDDSQKAMYRRIEDKDELTEYLLSQHIALLGPEFALNYKWKLKNS